ncbi:hypothetical protein E4U15_005654 [Claviceps sp. LM218 group G6]|nr:hypothetical protein E4U15_005654 [Claviceps sp. LM218 group G6]
MAIRYDKLDQDLDISVLMTTNIFTWLREQDGWPVAERGIRDCLDEHFMSDDDDDQAETEYLAVVPLTPSGHVTVKGHDLQPPWLGAVVPILSKMVHDSLVVMPTLSYSLPFAE